MKNKEFKMEKQIVKKNGKVLTGTDYVVRVYEMQEDLQRAMYKEFEETADRQIEVQKMIAAAAATEYVKIHMEIADFFGKLGKENSADLTKAELVYEKNLCSKLDQLDGLMLNPYYGADASTVKGDAERSYMAFKIEDYIAEEPAKEVKDDK